jgi:hypothetical protein
MSRYLLSWVIGLSGESQGGNLKDPGWIDVQQRLSEINGQAGTLTLNRIDGPEIGPQNLQVQTEGGFSVLSLGEDNGDDYIVRSFKDDSAAKGTIRIMGNEWSRRLVCVDFQIVLRVFEDFFNSGDVSRELLS